MVGAAGFEPAALWSQTRCATKLRYAPKTYYKSMKLNINVNGGGGGIRTHVGFHPNGFQDRPVMTASVPLQKIGDPSAIRTRDTLIKSQVLCRLS